MADMAGKLEKIARDELAPGETVRAAFRAKFKGLRGLAGELAPKGFSAPKQAEEQVATGWPTTVSSDGGTLVGVTETRVLVTEVPSIMRRNHSFGSVPLAVIESVATEKSSPGFTRVVVQLRGGGRAQLDAFGRDHPEDFVAAVTDLLR